MEQKSYCIKIPVYTTTMIDQSCGLFGNVTYQDMLQMVRKKIDDFRNPISTSNRNKTKKTVINRVSYQEVKIGDVPSLLLQISAFTTNIYDGYFEADTKIQIAKENKIGSDANYALLYPRIQGLTQETDSIGPNVPLISL